MIRPPLVRAAALAALAAALVVPAPAGAVDLASGEGGHVLATWQPLGDGDHPLRGAFLEAGGARFSKPFAVAPGRSRLESAAVGPNGDVVVAWSAVRPVPGVEDDEESRLHATVRPRGAAFGASVPLTGFQNLAGDAVASVNARGDVLVLWEDSRLRLHESFRPAGGDFGPAVPVPHGLRVGRLQLDDAGGAVLVAERDRSEPATTRRDVAAAFRSPDGTWSEPQAISDPADRLAHLSGFAANSDGRAYAAWTTDNFFDGDSLQFAERAPGQPFAPPAVLAGRDGSTGGLTGGRVAAGAGGRAAVMWLDRDGVQVLARDEPGPFGPRLFAGPGPLAGDEPLEDLVHIAMGDSGALGVAWLSDDGAVRASYRPPGGGFLPHARLGRRVTGPPEVAVGRDGRAIVAWESAEPERVRQLVRVLGADGAGPVAEIATNTPWARVGPPSACFPRAGRTVARNGRAHVFRMRVRGEGDLLFGCLLARGAYEELTFNPFPPVALAGPLVAFGDQSCTGDGCETSVYVRDLRGSTDLGRSALMGPGANPQLGSIRLKPNGAVAWIACPGGRSESFGSNRLCRRPGPLARVYAIDAGDEDPRLVARGRRIDPSSLRLRGSRITFRDGRRIRSAPLR